MLSVIDAPKLVQDLSGGLAFECSDHVAQHNGRRIAQQEVDMVDVTVNLSDFAVAFGGQLPQDLVQKVSPLSGECRMAKFRTKDDVSRQVIDAVACCVKVKIPDTLAHGLDDLLARCGMAVERMLYDRTMTSSKYYADLVPCVVSKSLICKYQKNQKCKRVRNLVIPVCGDKGKQIKLVEGGIRIPALFKKEVLPVSWPRQIDGHVRSIEMFRREGEWFASICYGTTKPSPVPFDGVIGVDRN
jgi:hypothetical protein